jgi:Putative transposase/Transposase zinc-binding domain
MPEIADIFRCYGADYLERFGAGMLPSHLRALRDLAECRTESFGGHLAVCDHCGEWRYSYHSCRNRSCPKCHGSDTEKWLDERRSELLPVPYFHIVFTLPKELHEIVRAHQKTLYDALIKTAASSLMTLARDPRYVGGTIALLCVLHTWTRAMIYHPHVHCLVPAGGLSHDGSSWLPARTRFLVPVRALSEIFRARFMDLARRALPGKAFPDSLWETDWVVYSKPSVHGADNVLRYLARYIHRIAITNNRILSFEKGQVTFRYKDSRQRCWKTMTLPALEFMRRFLQHVLPRAFHKVRSYGLLAPANRQRLHQINESLFSNGSEPKPTDDQRADPQLIPAEPESSRCPHCHIGSLVVILFLPYRRRAPP